MAAVAPPAWDVVIVGGGPSGISTALHLQAAAPDARILVLEKERYPREKICAGGIGARAFRLLDKLGVEVRCPHVTLDAVAMRLASDTVVVREPSLGAVVRRVEFDHAFAQVARARGIEVREGCAVESLAVDADGVTITVAGNSARAPSNVGLPPGSRSVAQAPGRGIDSVARTPSGGERMSGIDSVARTPSSGERMPGSDSVAQTPGSGERMPGIDSVARTPSSGERMPGSGSVARTPSSAERMPGTGSVARTPSSAERMPGTGSVARTPGSAERMPGSVAQTPDSAERMPGSVARRPGDGPGSSGIERAAGDVERSMERAAGDVERSVERARVVVGADGVAGVVRRQLGLGRGELRAQVVELDTEVAAPDLPRDTVVFDFATRALRGYAWDFPTVVAGEPLVCRGVYALGTTDAPRARLADYLAARGLEIGRYRVKQFAERGFEPGAALSRPRVLLVGEAAGIDIATGEGIGQAIEYGAVAGPYLARCLADDTLGFADWRRAIDLHHLGLQLRIRHLAHRAFYGRGRATLERMLPRLPALMRAGVQDFAGVPVSGLGLVRGALQFFASAARITRS